MTASTNSSTPHCCRGGKEAAPPGKYDRVPEGHSGPVFICPMCPGGVRDTRASSCPMCGMALEPDAASPGAQDTGEFDDMRRRFLVSAALTLPLVVLTMAEMLPGRPLAGLAAGPVARFGQLLLAAPVVLWAGWPFFARGWQSLRTRNLNMFTLIALGVGVAFVYSLMAVLVPQVFPPAFRDGSGEVALYFEAAGG